jgi:hypothetical protein
MKFQVNETMVLGAESEVKPLSRINPPQAGFQNSINPPL